MHIVNIPALLKSLSFTVYPYLLDDIFEYTSGGTLSGEKEVAASYEEIESRAYVTLYMLTQKTTKT